MIVETGHALSLRSFPFFSWISFLASSAVALRRRASFFIDFAFSDSPTYAKASADTVLILLFVDFLSDNI